MGQWVMQQYLKTRKQPPQNIPIMHGNLYCLSFLQHIHTELVSDSTTYMETYRLRYYTTESGHQKESRGSLYCFRRYILCTPRGVFFLKKHPQGCPF